MAILSAKIFANSTTAPPSCHVQTALLNNMPLKAKYKLLFVIDVPISWIDTLFCNNVISFAPLDVVV